MDVPDRLPGVSHFCKEMIAPCLLRAGGANGMKDCLEKERNREMWGSEGPVRR